MHRYITDRDRLAIYQVPSHTPDLNPAEGIWSVLRRTTTADRAFADPHDLITAVRRGLRECHRSEIRHDCLDGTRLQPNPP